MIFAVAMPAAAIPPPGASGCSVFPSNNVWHADVSHLPVNAHSSAWLGSMNASSTHLHPDFGPSGGFPYGIPYDVVSSSHAKISLTFDYADESDTGPYPFDGSTKIEGGQNAGGDRHAIMIDSGTCKLYELYDAHYNSPTSSTAGSGAIWSLTSNALRPAGWTSADAAGLPIFPGLVRLDEVNAGNVDHAIRVTAQQTDRSYIWPARHQAGAASNPNLPPMGARFRLKASYDISHFRADTQTILRAMKKYGLIVADNGSNWYFQGSAENGWNTNMLDDLKTVPASQFEAIDESSLMVSSDSAAIKTTTSRPPRRLITNTPSTPRPTPSRHITTTVSAKTLTTKRTGPSPATSPSVSSRVVAAQTHAKQDTTMPLWLFLLASAAGALVLFLGLRARQKSNLPSK